MSLARLAEIERTNPEWRSWTAMLRLLAGALDDPVWRSPVAEPFRANDGNALLDGHRIHVPLTAATQLIADLLDVAGARLPVPIEEPLALLQASITGAASDIEKTALRIGIDPGMLATVASAAAVPLLGACAAQFSEHLPRHWEHGWCPVCGEWPVLAELLGLDQSRRLRCGRCGTGWNMRWMVCCFCGEADHLKLGSLVSGVAGGGPKSETCLTCRCYLKTVGVLTSSTHLEVLVADLQSVALDLGAREQGFTRPASQSRTLTVVLVSSERAG